MAAQGSQIQVKYSPEFYKLYKKMNVRVRSRIDSQLEIFVKNPQDPRLDNHNIHGEWEGHRSINVTNDWRALYTEKLEGKELIAYFVEIGTHNQLYGKKKG